MKISVKQGRLMALMVAMILIIGIFVVGKMLGYGSTKNLYLLEGYGDNDDDIEGMVDEEEEEIDEAFGADIEDDNDHDDEGFIEEKGKCKDERRAYKKCGLGLDKNAKKINCGDLKKDLQACRNKKEGFYGGEPAAYPIKEEKEKEEFTCGAKSGVPAYDKDDDIYARF
tara:strand:+ start:278 stop:784 length:507 start_codon:yes stop_codon:yes gene_type:complete